MHRPRPGLARINSKHIDYIDSLFILIFADLSGSKHQLRRLCHVSPSFKDFLVEVFIPNKKNVALLVSRWCKTWGVTLEME